MAFREIHFIRVSPHSARPTGSAKQRSVTHSHAARSTHAKTRRLRTIQYQAQKRCEEHRQPEDLERRPRIGRTSLNGPLSASRRDPFMTFAVPLKPWEQMLFDHYVTVVVPLMRCNESDIWFSQSMTQIWVPHALSEESLLNILFLASCRHLSVSYRQCQQQQQQEVLFAQLALQYKLKSLQSLRRAISVEASSFTDSTVATPIMLSYDELFIRDDRMLRHHVEGAVRMVGLNGGPQTLGLNGLLAQLLSNLLAKVASEIGLEIKIPWDDRNQ